MPDYVLRVLTPEQGDERYATKEQTGVFKGTTDPKASLEPGTEYVWMKTDGAGTLLDIVSGVA